MPTTDHYRTLQVDSQADKEVIHAAYHALCVKYSGDQAKMKLLNEAKATLLNDSKKATYDLDRKPTGKRIVGDYRILAKIAEGGFGTTYKAEHVKLGNLVCIKHAINVSPTDEKILLEEASSMWDLRHWGIPAIRDILTMPDNSLSLVMSYIPGPTLTEVLEKNPNGIEAEHVAWIVERVLNILKYLHMHGVVHGDVKPQNIIIQPESHTVVLVDYGLSAVKPSSSTSAKGYTPHFAAPEQIEGKPPIPETDLFGLGMCMIYALGGDVERVKVPSHVPDGMCGFIKRLIKREPCSRPRVWKDEDLCETIKEVRATDFRRVASNMKPLKI